MASIGSLSLVSETKTESSAILLRSDGNFRRPRFPFFSNLPRKSLESGRLKGLARGHKALRAIGKRSEGGEGSDDSEDALQATIEKSKKVLAMQRDLLQQIAERKKLIASIQSSTIDPGEDDDPVEQEESSFLNTRPVDDKNTVEDENGSIVSSTYASSTLASSGGYIENAGNYGKDLPKETATSQVDPIKQWKGAVFTKPSAASRDFNASESKQGKDLPKKTAPPQGDPIKHLDTTFTKPVAASRAFTETESKLERDLPKKKPLSQVNPIKYSKKASSEADWSDPLPSFLLSTSEVSTLKDDKKTKLEELALEVADYEQDDPSDEEAKPPPLAGANVMNIIIIAAECAPWSKTGGLGDVAGALPKALARRGHRVMVVAPRYGNYPEPKDTGVRKRYKAGDEHFEVAYFQTYIDGVDFVFIDNHMFRHVENNIYGGNRVEILKRMVLYCKAAVEVPWHVPCGGVPYGDGNLVFIANDWHTSLLPVYLKAYYRDNGLMRYARSVLVIHNIAHQGRGPVDDFFFVDLPHHYLDLFKLYDPVGGDHFNIFAAGLKTADRIVTVSHGYAWELKTSEGGWGLHGIINENDWKLRGIVNGVDTKEWNPECDVHLTTDGYTNYSLETLKMGKPKCKTALQKELGLPVREDVPLIGFIGRLDQQKGVDLIAEAIPWMMGQDVQLVMLGTGRPDLEQMLREFENQHRDKVRGWVGFSVKMAHRITAGADILLMPSRFEPCGLNQLYAMMYGTIPVVHGVGGLRDTVQPFNPYKETGVGWTFESADSSKLIHALGNCLYTYREYKKSWEGLQRRGMTQDLSWDKAAQNYEEVLMAAKYQW